MSKTTTSRTLISFADLGEAIDKYSARQDMADAKAAIIASMVEEETTTQSNYTVWRPSTAAGNGNAPISTRRAMPRSRMRANMRRMLVQAA